MYLSHPFRVLFALLLAAALPAAAGAAGLLSPWVAYIVTLLPLILATGAAVDAADQTHTRWCHWRQARRANSI